MLKQRELLIVGAGGHGKVVADAAIEADFDVIGFVDDVVTVSPIQVLSILGTTDAVSTLYARQHVSCAFIAVGDNASRRKLAVGMQILGIPFATIVHPHAVVSSYSSLGEGTIVMPGAIVNAGASVGRHVILNTACSLDHDCRVGDYAHVSPGVHLAGNVTVGEGAHIGIGASVIPGCSIGDWSIIGAGATVVTDIPPNSVAVGIPARVIRTLQGD